MAKLNKSTHNPSKSHAFIISQTINKASTNLTLYLNSNNLRIARRVITDNKLFFEDHIKYIYHRKMTKFKHLLPIQILQNIHFALIHSYFNYGTLVWGATFNSYLSPWLTQKI